MLYLEALIEIDKKNPAYYELVKIYQIFSKKHRTFTFFLKFINP